RATPRVGHRASHRRTHTTARAAAGARRDVRRARRVRRRLRPADRAREPRGRAPAQRDRHRARRDLLGQGVPGRDGSRRAGTDPVLVNVRLSRTDHGPVLTMTETDLPELTFHIYPPDCDMLGHLNHASMLNFLERARGALLEPQVDIRNWAR